MRDIETIETELMAISAIPDDLLKLERIIAWCASLPTKSLRPAPALGPARQAPAAHLSKTLIRYPKLD
jgi:hypothetical protein